MKKSKNQPIIKNKKEVAFEKMVAQCIKNSDARRHDPIENEIWRKQYVSMLRTGQRPVSALSNNASGICYTKKIDDSKWRNIYKDNEDLKLREEIAQKEVDIKRKQVAPAYNKGGYQFISDLKDLPTLGRKI